MTPLSGTPAEHPRRHRFAFVDGDAGHIALEDASVTVVLAINSLHQRMVTGCIAAAQR
jgi:ubiquinone/menaquinone biosynthesis C-methylase UbiE